MKFHSNIYGWEYVWRDFADSRGGEVVADETQEGSPILYLRVPVESTDAQVTISPYGVKKVDGTFASVHYSPREHFSFAIRSERRVDQIGKALGMQDIQLGDTDFDQRYLIQGSDVGKVRNLLADMKLRDLILENSLSELRLVGEAPELPEEHKLPSGRHAILYGHDSLIDKFEHLEAIFHILTSVVYRLGVIPALAGEEEACDSTESGQEIKGSRLHSPLLDMS